jgi:hypothetical protein
MAERGKKLSGALRNDPKNKPTERLSPGVYRSAGGGLVTQGGRQIQRPTQVSSPYNNVNMNQGQSPTNWVNDQVLRNFSPGQFDSMQQSSMGMDAARAGAMAGLAGSGDIDPGSRAPDSFRGMLNPGASAPQFDPNRPDLYHNLPGQIQNGLGQPMTMPQIPQASANNGGRYRLSPGVYGTQQQAMDQYNQQTQQFNASLPARLIKRY